MVIAPFATKSKNRWHISSSCAASPCEFSLLCYLIVASLTSLSFFGTTMLASKSGGLSWLRCRAVLAKLDFFYHAHLLGNFEGEKH